MDTAAEETNVEWYEWGQEPFEIAARTGKPLLLSLVTRWSEECREMDETTYTEPRTAAHINDGFVPVRVDADRHPRVRERYHMGGFPSTVFLTPSGTILTGATLLGVDGFRQILDGVRKRWDGQGEDAGSVPPALRENNAPAGPLDARIEEHMIEQLLAAYDEEFGGWGDDVKFPMARTIEFALVRARDQATRTADAVTTHLLDTYDGGFYRFARNRNWGGARCEKLTDENAALVRALSYAYRYTGEDSYRTAAEQTVQYLTTTMWTGSAFASAQGGDESYFRLEPTEREDREEPPVDETVFADRNGYAIDALLRYWSYTDDDRAQRYAERARDHVTNELIDDGAVRHYQTGEESGLLSDQTGVLTGLTTAGAILGEMGPARAVADWTIAELQTDEGTLRDGPPAGPGLLERPLYPLDTTADCADALLDLALLTGEDKYETAAREAITAFAGATERMGVQVAQYATISARLRSPQALVVGTEAGTDLHRAALRLVDHETVVVPSGNIDRTPLVDAPVSNGTARLVREGTVVGTATTPHELESLLTG